MPSKRAGLQPLAITLTLLAAAVRIVPHPPNFTPIGAVALFGGSRLRGWQAYLIPLLALMATDPLRSWMEGGYPAYSRMTLVVYGCFLLSVLLGRYFLRGSAGVARVACVALASSIQFFVTTNFAVWLSASQFYPRSWAGLTECYIAALPFFAYTVLGDLFYCGVLFGAFALVQRHATETRPSTIAAA